MQRRTELAALMSTFLLLACSDVGGSAPAPEQVPASTEQSRLLDFEVARVVDGLEHPWGIAFLPDGDILLTERPGRLRLVRDGTLVDEPVPGAPEVAPGGQGGLLDIALHPDFENNRWVYFTYSKAGSGEMEGERTTAVARGRFAADRIEAVEDVYVAEAWADTDRHFGSRLAFDTAGRLYVSVGERGQMDEAQNLANDQGTVLRLHDDGTIPVDNPFAGQANASGAVWTYGNRNIQGLAFHPDTGELWASEHGPLGGDEINVIREGRNYGWPEITYGKNYDGSTISEDTHREGMEQPVHHWDEEAPAVAGLDIYTGSELAPWTGHHFVGGLAGRQLLRLAFDGERLVDSEALLTGLEQRIRTVRTGPDGLLYLLVDSEDAPMLRLEPVSP